MESELLTKPEVARRIGLGMKSVQRLVKAGAFPNAIRHLRALRIPASDVKAYLDSRRVVKTGGAA